MEVQVIEDKQNRHNKLLKFFSDSELTKIEDEAIQEKIYGVMCYYDGELAKLTSSLNTSQDNFVSETSQYEKSLTTLSAQLKTATSENAQLQQDLIQTKVKYESMVEKESRLSLTCEDTMRDKLDLSKQNAQLYTDKVELMEQGERRSREIDRLNDELKSTLSELERCNQAKCDAIVALDEIKCKELGLEYREKRIAEEKSLMQEEVQWLRDELSSKSEAYLELRQSSGVQTSQLRLELEAQVAEAGKVGEQLTSERASHERCRERLERGQEQVKQLVDQGAEQEQHFLTELNAKQTLADTYKESYEGSLEHIKELNTGVDDLQSLLNDATQAQNILEEQLADLKRKKDAEMQSRDDRILALQDELAKANDLLTTAKTSGGAMALSASELCEQFPLAAASAQSVKSGISLTQHYSEYAKCKEELVLKRHENTRLNSYLDEILNELDRKAPLLERQREEHERGREGGVPPHGAAGETAGGHGEGQV